MEIKTSISAGNGVTYRDYVKYAIGVLPDTLESFSVPSEGSEIAYNIFSGLIYKDEAGGFQPALAKSYKVSEDGLCYEFTLKTNLKWSDGSSITNYDIYNFYLLKGRELGSIVKLKDDVLSFTLKATDEDFLNMLSTSKYFLTYLGDDLSKWKENYKTIKYSGPFKITDLTTDSRLELTKNKFYFKSEYTASDKIVLVPSVLKELSLAQFYNGEVDGIAWVPAIDFTFEGYDDRIRVLNSCMYGGILFNTNNKVANIIQKLNYSIDRNFVSVVFLKNLAEGVEPAKVTLKSEAVSSGEIITINLLCLEDSISKSVCSYIKSTLEAVGGVKVIIVAKSTSEFNIAVASNEYDLAFIKNVGKPKWDIGENFIPIYKNKMLLAVRKELKGIAVTEHGEIFFNGARLTNVVVDK